MIHLPTNQKPTRERHLRLCQRISSLVWLGLAVFVLAGHADWAIGQEASVSESTEGSSAQADQQMELDPAMVRKLVRQLEARGLAERDDAERKLVELGVGIEPFLPEVNSRTSGEMKIRLQRIRSSFESQQLENYFEPSKVSLTGKMGVPEAIDAVIEQTGNDIQLQGADALEGVEVELDHEDALFWDVVSDIMEQGNLQINAFGSTEGELVLAAGGGSEGPPPFMTGPFRVNVSSVQVRRPFFSQLDGQLDLSLQVTWEPRLKPVFMQIPMASVNVDLGNDQALAATNPQASPEIPLNYGGSSTQIDLQLERPDRSEERIEKLSGEFVIAVPSDRHKYVFKKFGNGARQTEKYGDVRVTLEGARRNGAVYEMRILVEFGNSQGALDSFRGWILSNTAYLLDPKGVRRENVGLQTYGVSANAVGIAYLFQINGNPDDFQLVYESPGIITRQTVTYELTDIDLP